MSDAIPTTTVSSKGQVVLPKPVRVLLLLRITFHSKGQVVLPKPVRDALRIKPGAQLGVAIEGTRVILETAPQSSPSGWKPLNPAGVRLSTRDMCKPVDLRRTDASRSR